MVAHPRASGNRAATLSWLHCTILLGFSDQGVAARRMTIVKKGPLYSFSETALLAGLHGFGNGPEMRLASWASVAYCSAKDVECRFSSG